MCRPIQLCMHKRLPFQYYTELSTIFVNINEFSVELKFRIFSILFKISLDQVWTTTSYALILVNSGENNYGGLQTQMQHDLAYLFQVSVLTPAYVSILE